MKTNTNFLAILGTAILGTASLHAATSTMGLTIAQLRGANGSLIADGGGSWAIIVSGLPGSPPTSGSLPGGLSNDSSLSMGSVAQVKSDFDNVELTVGQPLGKNYFIQQTGGFSGGNDLSIVGAVQTEIIFNVFDNPDAGFAAGTLWGFYWFPGQSLGATLGGNYEVGGFANSYNAASAASIGGDVWGTTIGNVGSTLDVAFLETNFNQNDLSGGDTGLSVARFTAVAVPEPSALMLSALGLAALFRRTRQS